MKRDDIPRREVAALEYLRARRAGLTPASFDTATRPDGDALRANLLARGLIHETPHGRIAITAAGRALLEGGDHE